MPNVPDRPAAWLLLRTLPPVCGHSSVVRFRGHADMHRHHRAGVTAHENTLAMAGRKQAAELELAIAEAAANIATPIT